MLIEMAYLKRFLSPSETWSMGHSAWCHFWKYDLHLKYIKIRHFFFPLQLKALTSHSVHSKKKKKRLRKISKFLIDIMLTTYMACIQTSSWVMKLQTLQARNLNLGKWKQFTALLTALCSQVKSRYWLRGTIWLTKVLSYFNFRDTSWG